MGQKQAPLLSSPKLPILFINVYPLRSAGHILFKTHAIGNSVLERMKMRQKPISITPVYVQSTH